MAFCNTTIYFVIHTNERIQCSRVAHLGVLMFMGSDIHLTKSASVHFAHSSLWILSTCVCYNTINSFNTTAKNYLRELGLHSLRKIVLAGVVRLP